MILMVGSMPTGTISVLTVSLTLFSQYFLKTLLINRPMICSPLFHNARERLILVGLIWTHHWGKMGSDRCQGVSANKPFRPNLSNEIQKIRLLRQVYLKFILLFLWEMLQHFRNVQAPLSDAVVLQNVNSLLLRFYRNTTIR